MKIILSRKGFDSANGSIPSPIFEDGTMLSFPIPSDDVIRYDELVCNGIGLDKILSDLKYKGDKFCHLDPDLILERRKVPVEGWKAAYGQINQSASYLLNNNVEEGDLFLFFGNFRNVKNENGVFKYARRTKNSNDPYYGKQIQAIWGYLQIGKILKKPEEQEAFFWHPHSSDHRVYQEKNNLIFTARDTLSFAPNLPGCGVFSYDEKRVLSMPGRPKATWKQCAAYDLNNIAGCNRKNSAKNGEGIYYAGIWQELVLKDNDISKGWAKSLF